ncbi:MAG: Ribonuclease P protein component [Parcubacteria group bacterium GW2011_GWA2_39_18]|nr:MAG: Ribonuclease P protein component [Parcubacteria group bacterium GW2011_GWA2_39_18]
MQKIHSLRLKKDIDLVFKKGRKHSSRAFYLKCIDSKKSFFRYAIVVSSKISKKATTRNKIRRQIKEIIRKHQKIILPVDFVVLVQKSILEKKFKEIEEEMLFLLNRIK